ncbi:MAG: hypothetical protein ACM3S2_14945, partial [Ignavibacteriales bacterium]
MKLNCPAENKTIIFSRIFPLFFVLFFFLTPAIGPGAASASITKDLRILSSNQDRYNNVSRIIKPGTTGSSAGSLSLDSLAKSLVSQLNADSIRSTILALQSFKDRYELKPNRRDVVKWIKEKFTSYGFSSVETDSFECTVQDHRNNGATATAWQRNVVATIT